MVKIRFVSLLILMLAAVPAVLLANPPSSAPSGDMDSPLTLVQTIPLNEVQGRIDHLAVDAQAMHLYVTGLENNTLEILDLQAGKQIRRLEGLKHPTGIWFLRDSKRLVVASSQDHRCRFYDESLALLGEIKGLPDADNVRYDPQTQRVYVAYGDGALAVIDAAKIEKVAEIKLDGHPESFQLESNGPRIFANVPDGRQIAVIDREENTVITKWPVTLALANFPMALDEKNHRLLVACRKPARLLVLNTETGKPVAEVNCCGDVDDLFYDAARRRVYLSGGEGCISVFEQKDADHYPLLKRVETAPGARTCLFVPETSRLYLAVPLRGPQKAEIRVYQAK